MTHADSGVTLVQYDRGNVIGRVRAGVIDSKDCVEGLFAVTHA